MMCEYAVHLLEMNQKTNRSRGKMLYLPWLTCYVKGDCFLCWCRENIMWKSRA